jgi:hypothetical protein
LSDTTGGKACADDANVRAKATAINLSIASLLFFLDVLARPDREAQRGEVGFNGYLTAAGCNPSGFTRHSG